MDMGPKNLILGKPIQETFKFKGNETTKIHVVKLSDGSVQTLDAGIWSVVFHYGNSYMRDADTIVTYVSHYTDPKRDPLTVFWKKKLLNHDIFTDQNSANSLARFIINLKDGTVKVEELYVPEQGSVDFPQYNPLFKGVKENRYTYLTSVFGPKVVDENYKWTLKKYDSQEKKMVKEWGPDGIMSNEARFVADPNGGEEDGIIFMMGYNWKEESTSLFVIDPKSMETLQEYKLPSRLGLHFHNSWWSHEALKDVLTPEFI